jgi:N-acetyl sugar amidotransferase
MSRINNLVILVADYPFGIGESFLEDEIKVLESKFDKIYLVQTSNNVKPNPKFELYIPKNAIIHNLNNINSKIGLLKKIKVFFSSQFIYELFLATTKHKTKFSFSLVKLVSYYWSTSEYGLKLLKEFINKYQINTEETIFYSYWCDSNTISLARLKSKDKKINFVTRLHGWDLYFERHASSFLPFREFIFNKSKMILPISNDGRKYIIDKKLCIKTEKIITSRLGVDNLMLNKRYNKKEEKSTNFISILTLSHINPLKRLDRLVEVLEKIEDIEIVWHIIGYGFEPYESQFLTFLHEKLKSKKNIEYKFHGQLAKHQVISFLENEPLDLIVNCSDTEGIPVSLMEASSAGIPAIAFDIGGIPSVLIDNYNGFLLKYDKGRNIENLENALRKFTSLSIDGRFRFSENAKKNWSELFNSNQNYKNLARLLKGEIYKPDIIFCNKCIITSEIYPNIILDRFGVCDICNIVETKNTEIEKRRSNNYLTNLLDDIKAKKGNNKYDCLLGISGGVDSAYLALKVKEWGLNPLLVHIDTGWNSELAVDNIKSLIDQLGFELYTVVIDWNEIQDVVKAFMRASVIDIDWANELSAQASLNKVAAKFKIKHILTGHQVATEGWMPSNIVHFKLDLINFKAIHRRFGERRLKTYPTIGFARTYYYEKIANIKFYNPLDYIPYVKEDVKKILSEQYGWRDYGHKHYENIFTRFYQGYILPTKFKVDKRIFHYSAMIVSGQLTKEKALELIKNNPYDNLQQLDDDKEFVMKKLGFTNEEFEKILNAKPKSHLDYPSIINIINKLKKIKNVIQNNR